MGASSPHAAFDLVCPTVGGVLAGLAGRRRRARRSIRASARSWSPPKASRTDRQHIWEGFPGPGGRFTTYLFYYTEPAQLPEQPLLSLYERFFATRPRYKRGDATLREADLRLHPRLLAPAPDAGAPRDRVLLVGDAAGRHSPLTFCGFGSMIRSFLPVADALRERLADDRLDARALASVWREPPGLQVMGGLTLMMVPGATRARATRTTSIACSTPPSLRCPSSATRSTARSCAIRSAFADFMRFMRATAKRRPSIYDEVFAQLSPAEIARWSLRLGRLALQQVVERLTPGTRSSRRFDASWRYCLISPNTSDLSPAAASDALAAGAALRRRACRESLPRWSCAGRVRSRARRNGGALTAKAQPPRGAYLRTARTISGPPMTLGSSQYTRVGNSRQMGRLLPLST